MPENPLKLRKIHHIQFWVGNALQAAEYYRRAFGFTRFAYAGLETGQRAMASHALRQGTIRLVMSSPLAADHPASAHVAQHGDGVRDIAFEVDDADAAFGEAVRRGARPAVEPHEEADEHGAIRRAAIHTYGDTLHSFISLNGYAGPFLPGYRERLVEGEDAGLLRVDHVVGNVELGKMNEWADWYSAVLGFKRYITFEDKDISTEYSALMSIVMSDNSYAIKFPINEPAPGRKKSQIDEYLDFYGGPGVQHIAMLTTDITRTVRALKGSGVPFLTVPDSYYQSLPDRVGRIDEGSDTVRDLGILVDRDEEGYLLQLFTKPVEDRPTLFFEVIQRKGSRGFGKGNFRALFEAIEREQALRGNLWLERDVPTYQQMGQIPRKRHTVFRRPDGGLYSEELMGNKGFDGLSSLIYHVYPPTRVRHVRTLKSLDWDGEDGRQPFHHRHFRTGRLPETTSAAVDRIPILFNADVALSFVAPQAEEDVFYRNAQGDELVYVSEGSGTLESLLGDIGFDKGDYLVIPRGIVHRYRFRSKPVRLLVIESTGEVRTPTRYRNEHGQLLEHAPYSERDIRGPATLQTRDEKGEFPILIKKGNEIVEYVLDHHPFDVVGWDGFYYPWALNISDFEPRVGRFHLPPPTHQTFEGDGFVVCSFCPRPYDFDPAAVPVPYNHSNVMSDEVIYYASSEFMSRKGIEYGSITLHPDGIPHGPHPGRVEQSLGQKRTDELAVMLDSFRPLRPSKQAMAVEDEGYPLSWLEEP